MTEEQKKTPYCKHLGDAYSAKKSGQYADKKSFSIEELTALVKDKDIIHTLQEAASNGIIAVFSVPGENLVVPSFSSPTHEAPLNYIHVRNDSCPLSSCKDKKSKLHTLGEISNSFSYFYFFSAHLLTMKI